LARASVALKQFSIGLGLAVAAIKTIHAAASGQVESQRGTAQYSGLMASSAAALDVGRLGREMQTAKGTEGSFSKLTVSLNKLENAMQPFREVMTNLTNNVLTGLVNVATSAVNLAKPMLDALNWAGSLLSDGIYAFRSWWEFDTVENIKKRDAEEDKKEKEKLNIAMGQNFQDMLNLRQRMSDLAVLNHPRAGIPRRPAKGGGGGGGVRGGGP
jgi:hypothetical protein